MALHIASTLLRSSVNGKPPQLIPRAQMPKHHLTHHNPNPALNPKLLIPKRMVCRPWPDRPDIQLLLLPLWHLSVRTDSSGMCCVLAPGSNAGPSLRPFSRAGEIPGLDPRLVAGTSLPLLAFSLFALGLFNTESACGRLCYRIKLSFADSSLRPPVAPALPNSHTS